MGGQPVGPEVPGWVDSGDQEDELHSQYFQRTLHADPSQSETNIFGSYFIEI